MQQLFLLTTFILCFITEGTVPSRSTNFRRNSEQLTINSGNEGRRNNNNNLRVVSVDVGTNYTLPCSGRLRNNDIRRYWRWDIRRDSRDKAKAQHTIVQEDGSLFFSVLQQSDSGIYSCQLESEEEDEDEVEDADEINNNNNNSRNSTGMIRNMVSHSAAPRFPSRSNYDNLGETRVRLRVRTPPLIMRNVTVLPSTVLASVMWESGDDGGYPISSFQLRYRLRNESEIEWKTCQPNFISPDKRHIDIFHLSPNSTYIFEMWANNHLGKGKSTLVQISTHNDLQEIEGKYLLEGVETLDTRAWIVAVLVVLGTLLILVIATCCLFYKENYVGSWACVESRRQQRLDLEGESIELMPNIILNPSYEFQSMMEPLEPDENLNDTTPLRVNNNSVIFPTRV